MRRLALIAAAALIATPALAALPQGAKAPDFATRGALNGKIFKVRLRQQLKHGPVVLYFFPRAYTGGCNAEAHAFAEAINDFKAAGAQVIGMSTDTVPVLLEFSQDTKLCSGKFRWRAPGRTSSRPMMSRSA